MFHRAFPEIKVSASTIERTYRANKVRFKFIRSSKKVIDYSDMRYKKLLIECYSQVKKFRDKGVPIVYLDEAVFTFNTVRKKAWFSKNGNLKVSQESRNMNALALIAAIESERGLVSYAIHEGSINSEKFIAFLEQLKEHMSCPEICLYLDNLSVHRTKAVK
jgi:hypothetical protein